VAGVGRALFSVGGARDKGHHALGGRQKLPAIYTSRWLVGWPEVLAELRPPEAAWHTDGKKTGRSGRDVRREDLEQGRAVKAGPTSGCNRPTEFDAWWNFKTFLKDRHRGLGATSLPSSLLCGGRTRVIQWSLASGNLSGFVGRGGSG